MYRRSTITYAKRVTTTCARTTRASQPYLSLALAVVLSSCQSFNGSDIPQGQFIRVSPRVVSAYRTLGNTPGKAGKVIELEYAFRDNDGDLQSLSLIKKIINPPRNANPRTVSYPLPASLPALPRRGQHKGKLLFSFTFTELGEPRQRGLSDSVVFILLLTDKQGHVSDSIFSEVVEIQPRSAGISGTSIANTRPRR